jgi:MarR family transcriptional regulator, organic hydroperoxide resistance regulator
MTPSAKQGHAGGVEESGSLLPPPVTAADRIVLEIRKFIAAAVFFNAQAAEKAGLGLTDMQLLHMLQLYGPSTPSRLALWTGLSSGGMTVALDRLEKAGYVRRQPNPADRRSSLINLVPPQIRKLESLYQEVEGETRRLLATLPQADLEAALRFFEAMHAVKGGPEGELAAALDRE